MKTCFFGAFDPLYPRSAILREGLRANGVEVFDCRVPSWAKSWLRYPWLFGKSLPAARRADILLVPEFRQKDVPLGRLTASLFGRGLVHDPLASRYETKILDWKRKPTSSMQAWWNRVIDRWSFRLPDLVLADTAAHGDYFRREFGLAPEKTAVVPVGYDDRLFAGAPERTPGGGAEFTVLFAGSFLPLHGAETIVEAAALVGRKDRSIRFRMVGDGQTHGRAARLARELGADNLVFDGWSALKDLPGRLAGADVCLGIFGRTEKAGRVVPHKIFQAMGMGRPVVTARTRAVEEFFRHREDIVLCDPPGPGPLAEAVLELRSDAALRAKVAANGRDLVRMKYSTRPLGRLFLDVLRARFPGTDGYRA